MTEQGASVQSGLHTAQQEALRLLDGVVKAFTTGQQNLEVCLRSCRHACEILGWTESKSWFDRQLIGYSDGAEVDDFRAIRGLTRWAVRGTSFAATSAVGLVRSHTPGYSAVKHLQDQPCKFNVTADVRMIQTATVTGYVNLTGETYSHPPGQASGIVWEEAQVFQGSAFEHVLDLMSGYTFEFASREVAVLKYSDVLTGIWAQHLQAVEKFLVSVDMRQALDAIRLNYQSGSSETLRTAAFACRNLIEDLSRLLWQDPRESYLPLPGTAKGEGLLVSKDRYVNRLKAYIHQKSVGTNPRKFYEDEVDRLGASFRSLAAVQGQAHGGVSDEDARIIILGTFFLVGALVLKTDMQPVTHYEDGSQLSSDDRGSDT